MRSSDGVSPSLWLAVLLFVPLLACSKKAVEPTVKHMHHAPHHGALQVLGEEFAHVELVLVEGTGTLTAYVLDGEAEASVRIAQDTIGLKIKGVPGGDVVVELKAVASALTGERVGDTSQFEGASVMLKGVQSFTGAIETITVRGSKFDAVEIGFPGGNEHEETSDAGK